jgi:hypothetical protein
MIKIFARNYRGFRDLEFNLDGVTFLVGDNSSGKSSIVQLANYVISSGLDGSPALPDVLPSDKADFFSPYFKYEDVTIGFLADAPGEKLIKIITIRKRKDLMIPQVMRYTVISDGKRLTFMGTGERKYMKFSKVNDDLNIDDLYKLHEESNDYKLIKMKDSLGSKHSLNNALFLYEVLSHTDLKKEFKTALVNSIGPCIDRVTSHIGPLRGTPEPYYALERVYSSKGSHFAAMLHDIKRFKKSKYVELVNKFGRESQLFEELNVEKMSQRIAHSPLVVSVKKRGIDFSISQVGVGISQVLPVLVDSLFRKVTGSEVVMLLQQPELHLHPVAQAALGEFIYSMSDEKMWYFIETHSDYLMDRYRVNLREGENKIQSQIIFCENREDGNYAYTIKVKGDGTLQDQPDSYREFQVNELMRTFF